VSNGIMAGKTTDRKLKSKDAKSVAGNDQTDALANFSLPESLPCSEIEFPVLITKTATVNWQQILEEREQKFHEIAEYVESKHEKVSKAPFLKTECDYINNEVFSHLIPALEETLNKAKIWEALLRQKCFFNGIDNIVQVEYIAPEINKTVRQYFVQREDEVQEMRDFWR
ncbi:IQ domain-containing protein K, partial [Operophtera brumata]